MADLTWRHQTYESFDTNKIWEELTHILSQKNLKTIICCAL